MDSYKEFNKEIVNLEETWKQFEGHEEFKKFYIRFMYKKRLVYRVLKKFRAYKRETIPAIEAIETIIEPEEGLEIINTIRKYPRPLYSLKLNANSK